MTFKDHFSTAASGYAATRPTYPRALFEALAALAPARNLAWDCGAGNGQASLGLASFFEKVHATEPSAAQIRQAFVHSRITYECSAETAPSLSDKSVDLATAAQAAHWFDRDRYFSEVRRCLVPGGIVAVWCYELCEINTDIDALLKRFYSETVGPWWPPERRHIDNGYADFDFPFDEIPFPDLFMELKWSLEDFAGYLRTWSAVTRFQEKYGNDPVNAMEEDLLPLWGTSPRIIRWPLRGRLGRFSG